MGRLKAGGARDAKPSGAAAPTAVGKKHAPTAWRDRVKAQGDFFLYADCNHCYWTGYFASRPEFKRLERARSAFLYAVWQVKALAALLMILFPEWPPSHTKKFTKLKFGYP